MPEHDYGLRPVFFVKSCTITLGREERGMRVGFKKEIWGSEELGDLMRGTFKSIDVLAKNQRKADVIEA